jgi:hypothetical protein
VGPRTYAAVLPAGHNGRVSEPPRLSRREVISGAAALGVGATIAPAAALARPSVRQLLFSRRLGDLAGVSPVLETQGRFVMAGVEWEAPAAARIWIRAHSSDGGWSRWAVASVAGHEPDSVRSPGPRLGEPVWFGTADAVQVRAEGAVREVEVHFVAAEGGGGSGATVAADAADAADGAAPARALPLVTVDLPTGPGQPPIIARSAWATPRDVPGGGPFYGAIDLAFVHHTENPNGYSAGQVPAMLRAMYAYHRFTRGFYDIAYNFIIDAFGRIWEARAGGVDEPVVGAHAGGYNTVSTGVAVLGTFISSVPPPAAQQALERLLAWKLSLHGVPVLGKVRVQVNPSDAFYTPFRPGQRVMLPRVAGHRDGDQTDCPGNDFYDRLPAIRTRVAALAGVPSVLTLTASAATVPLASPVVTVTGRLSARQGAPIPGVAVAVQSISGVGVVTPLAAVTTAADGTWTAPPLTLTRSVVLRAVYAAAPAAVSDVVVVGVLPVITLTLASTAPLRVSGTVQPAKRHVTISVYRGAGRTPVLTRTVAVRRGSFEARLNLPRKDAHGTFRIVARTEADTVSAAGASAPLQLTR